MPSADINAIILCANKVMYIIICDLKRKKSSNDHLLLFGLVFIWTYPLFAPDKCTRMYVQSSFLLLILLPIYLHNIVWTYEKT